MSSRAAQRKQRLLEIEFEQKLEDAEALKMTDEQRQILLSSFTSVKFEFSDLDGWKWTRSALLKRQHATRPTNQPSHQTPAFAILTNADLASFNPEDTIRASSSRSSPRHRALYLQSTSSSNLSSCSSAPSLSSTLARKLSFNRSRARSPLSKLENFEDDESQNDKLEPSSPTQVRHRKLPPGLSPLPVSLPSPPIRRSSSPAYITYSHSGGSHPISIDEDDLATPLASPTTPDVPIAKFKRDRPMSPDGGITRMTSWLNACNSELPQPHNAIPGLLINVTPPSLENKPTIKAALPIPPLVTSKSSLKANKETDNDDFDDDLMTPRPNTSEFSFFSARLSSSTSLSEDASFTTSPCTLP